MNIRINLLPYEERPPKWYYGRLLMLPVLAVLLVIAVLFGYGEYRVWTLQKEYTETRSRHEALTDAEQQMKVAQTRLAAVQAREKILLQLSKSRYSWYGTMAHLGGFMPRQIWLSEIGSAQKGILQIKGSALNYQDLVAFLGTMENDKVFIEPVLLKAEQTEGNPVTQFEISTKVRGL
jgi:type IV pilus assembly protein PilN